MSEEVNVPCEYLFALYYKRLIIFLIKLVRKKPQQTEQLILRNAVYDLHFFPISEMGIYKKL